MATGYWIGWAAGSWGTSWGEDSSGTPIEVEEYPGGGGPDARDNSRAKPYYRETDEDLEHIELKAKHGRRIYAKEAPVVADVVQVAPVVVEPNQEAVVQDVAQGQRPMQVAMAIDVAAIAGDLKDAADSIDAIQGVLDERARRQREEEEALIMLLVA